MAVPIATPIAQIELTPGSGIRISGFSWADYQALLMDLGEDRCSRVAYDRGTVEIRMPGQIHEIVNRLLAAIVMTLAEEMGLECNDLGSVTLNRPDLERGIEPDSCFYLQNAQAGQGMATEISSDQPPDLALEVDIAGRSGSKLEIYRALGVPEVWIYRQEEVVIHRLQADGYVISFRSQTFPDIGSQQLNSWIQLRRQGTDLTVIRAVRADYRSC